MFDTVALYLKERRVLRSGPPVGKARRYRGTPMRSPQFASSAVQRWSLVGCSLLAFSWPRTPLPVAGALTGSQPLDPVVQNLHGWTVHVDPSLLEGEHAEQGLRAMSMLSNHLERVALLVVGERLEQLRGIELWIEHEHPVLKNMQYHPSASWLRRHGHDERLAKKVHLPVAQNLLSRGAAAEAPGRRSARAGPRLSRPGARI